MIIYGSGKCIGLHKLCCFFAGVYSVCSRHIWIAEIVATVDLPFFVLHLSYPLDGQCYRTMGWEGIVSCAVSYVIAVFFPLGLPKSNNIN
jgi:hypothetical protein